MIFDDIPKAFLRFLIRRLGAELDVDVWGYYRCQSESETSEFRICPNTDSLFARKQLIWSHNFGQTQLPISFFF